MKQLAAVLPIALPVMLAFAACSSTSTDVTSVESLPPTSVAAEPSTQDATPTPTTRSPEPPRDTTSTSTTTRPIEPTAPTTTLAPLRGLELVELTSELDQPVYATSPPGDDRVYVVERSGAIRILGQEEPFVDLDERVNSEDGIEPGLLGLAFHPDYQTNGTLYVYYYAADAPETRLSAFRVEGDEVDVGSERILRRFEQPTNRHNGGMLRFDPEGRLFLSLGEGGDASTHAQDPTTLLGTILRFDVTGDLAVEPASGNPFSGADGAPEVWAYGMRNPWRFDIDGGLLYIGDVGQEDWEEIDVIPADGAGGANLGWLEMEGTHCFRSGCDPDAYTLPVLEYSHEEGCSVTGGVVYRGAAIPELDGHYLYADWCGAWIRSFRLVDGAVTDPQERFTDVGQINGFGTDAAGEVYVLTYDGRALRIDPVR